MADFLTTKGISAEIEKIMTRAEKKLILISPYLQISSLFLKRLSQISERGVKTTIVYRQDKLRNEDNFELRKIRGLEIRIEKNLHAKCYYNEEKILIATMNLYDYSEQHNIEMGILLDRPTDKMAFEEALIEAENIVKNSLPSDLTTRTRAFTESAEYRHSTLSILGQSKAGYCIRCSEKISYDPNKPLCSDCFSSWNRFQDPDYQEEYCHSCGHHDDITFAYPECHSCYTKNKNKRTG